MQSKAATVDAYLKSLPDDRRAVVEAVRSAILKNLDAGFAEGMQYGMIGYAVPHAIYPDGYHCGPKQPLPFAALAAQKNHYSLYLMCLYDEQADLHAWFRAAWQKAGKKLDMGKGCVRFKRLDDVPLDVVGELFKRVTARKYIAAYESSLAKIKASKPQRDAARKKAAEANGAKSPTKSAARPAKKASKRPVAKSATR
jgi:hypothetical protein